MKTVQAIHSLKAAQFTQEQAEAIAAVMEAQGFEETKRDLAVIKWMLGFNMAMTLAILWKVFA